MTAIGRTLAALVLAGAAALVQAAGPAGAASASPRDGAAASGVSASRADASEARAPGASARTAEQVKVVYHLSEGVQQASRALGNIRNHLNAEPDAKIVVVTHGPGIDFLLDEAQDAKGRPFVSAVSELAGRGVEFRVCNNTLSARDIGRQQVLPEATIVDSGVAEVARLQARDGFVYLRP